MSQQFSIRPADWRTDKQALSEIRRKVFIEEQKVPEELEWDEFDECSYHILALDNQNKPIGTGRIKADGQIGRMAVLKEWRHKGAGKTILAALLEHGKQSGYPEIYLHAQLSAIPFYEKFGFIINSEEFMDADIAHKTMILKPVI